MSQIKDRLMDDVKEAMRAKDKDKLSIIRMIQAQFKQFEIDNRNAVLDEQKAVDLLANMINTRRQSIKQFELANRPELAAAEQAEIAVIEQYMPARMADSEVIELIKEAASALGASSVKDIGRVASHLREKIAGQVDSAHLNLLIKNYLTQ